MKSVTDGSLEGSPLAAVGTTEELYSKSAVGSLLSYDYVKFMLKLLVASWLLLCSVLLNLREDL